MNNEIQRNFILGDSWLYYKIYTGPKTSDAVLTEIIKPIAEELIEQGIITNGFLFDMPIQNITYVFVFTTQNLKTLE